MTTSVSIALEISNTGKFTTIVNGLPPDDAQFVLKTIKRTKQCSGNLNVLDDNSVEIRFQGDTQLCTRILMIEMGICTPELKIVPPQQRRKYQPAFVHDDE